MAPLAVQILDQNDQPVEGADVVFRFPLNGPSATFGGQRNAVTVRTDARGQARASGWSANDQAGNFQVQVTATRGSEMGQTTVRMTNVTRIVDVEKSRKRNWWSSKWAKVLVIGGAAGIGAGIYLANRNGGPSTTITGIPGAPTIGGPQ
jgi:hypothetical protein